MSNTNTAASQTVQVITLTVAMPEPTAIKLGKYYIMPPEAISKAYFIHRPIGRGKILLFSTAFRPTLEPTQPVSNGYRG
jgi:hypothetical protein